MFLSAIEASNTPDGREPGIAKRETYKKNAERQTDRQTDLKRKTGKDRQSEKDRQTEENRHR